jgi:hypothetical protein
MIKIFRKFKKNTAQDKCLRCGACCLAGEDVYHWCEYLFYTKEKVPTCMIYEMRIGKKLVNGQVCGLRYKTKYDYPNCPYNSNKPIHPFFKDVK